MTNNWNNILPSNSWGANRGGGGGGGGERDSYFTWPDKIGLDNDAHTYKTINEIKNKMT